MSLRNLIVDPPDGQPIDGIAEGTTMRADPLLEGIEAAIDTLVASRLRS